MKVLRFLYLIGILFLQLAALIPTWAGKYLGASSGVLEGIFLLLAPLLIVVLVIMTIAVNKIILIKTQKKFIASADWIIPVCLPLLVLVLFILDAWKLIGNGGEKIIAVEQLNCVAMVIYIVKEMVRTRNIV